MWTGNRYPVFVASRLVSQTGDMAALTALTVHVHESTGSPVAVGTLFLVRVLPRILGLVAGAIGDRVELRGLLMACDAACGVVFLVIALVNPGYPLLLALVFVAESAATITLPAARTMVGRTVPKEHLPAANGMLLAATAIGFASGSALGALLAGAGDYRWALVINAASFGGSILLLVLLPRAVPEPRSGRSFFAEATAGLAVLRRDSGVRPVVIGLVGVAFAAALDRPALIVLVRTDLGASALWYGLALGAISLGVLVASLSYRGFEGRVPALFGVGIVAQTAGHLTMGLAPVVGLVVLGALVAGLGNGLESVCGNTLLQRDAPKESLGVVLGVVLSGSFLADAAGSALGGTLVEWISAPGTFVLSAAVMLACVRAR
ncbi:MFS transporter [Allokutzneria albata]|uniref:Predicted arabinose efflux permease, MFS family n=1 Tax=Allokutzneria albata TaxID=211114 RepID=A0A1G9SZG5_ALLAB|nr:MFS transporter [Allokutzneria albata]SDM40782.1 Predicted arabinose efflux permease, MFS family [Allokutzneria albata]